MANETTEPKDAVDVLVPKAENRVITLGTEPMVVTYIQRPLSFFGKLEVFSVLGSVMDRALSGPDALTMSQIFEGPAAMGSELNPRNFRDADTFVKAIAKLTQYAPDLLSELYLVILAVPRGERALAQDMMERPQEEGGLSDEDGFGILETFIDQNWDVMVDFFNTRVKPLVEKISSKVQESQPSKPLKNTRQTTRKP